jgi:hypothetical protein
MLLPRELDIAAVGHEAPLPAPKPKLAALDIGKQAGSSKLELGSAEGRGKAGSVGSEMSPRKPKIAALDVKKRDDKVKANSANAGASAKGTQKLSPLPDTRIAALAVQKENRKGKSNSANGASAALKSIVLPVLKPRSPAIEGKKQIVKDKGETVGASSTAIAAGLHRPSSATKSKTATEIKKPEGNGKAKTVGASSTAIAASERKPSAATKSKAAKTEMKKPQGNGKAKAALADEDGRAAAKSPPQAAPARVLDIRSAWQ